VYATWDAGIEPTMYSQRMARLAQNPAQANMPKLKSHLSALF